jgi:hypothetical protein
VLGAGVRPTRPPKIPSAPARRASSPSSTTSPADAPPGTWSGPAPAGGTTSPDATSTPVTIGGIDLHRRDEGRTEPRPVLPDDGGLGDLGPGIGGFHAGAGFDVIAVVVSTVGAGLAFHKQFRSGRPFVVRGFARKFLRRGTRIVRGSSLHSDG